MGQVWSSGNSENTSETKPASQPRKDRAVWAEEEADEPGVLAPGGRESGQFLPSDIGATEAPQNLQDRASSPSSALEDKSRSEPSFDGVSAEKAAREAALLEFLRTFESPSVPIVQSECEREAPERASAFGWQHSAALGLLSLGVLALHQSRSRNRTAPELKTGKS